jgi:hypothetical protein
MPSMTPNIVVMLIIILVPIVPAYLLFKFLPSTAAADGPLQGLTIKLTGGFGGYFLIFLTLIGIRSSFQGTTYEVWAVRGELIASDTGVLRYVDQRYVTLSAPSMRSDSLENLSLTFLRSSDGLYDYPHLQINYPNYQTLTYWLGPKDQNLRNEALPVSFDDKGRTIDLGTITLVRVPTPAPDAPATNPYATQPAK